jgi:CheY-like chemotaxis protein
MTTILYVEDDPEHCLLVGRLLNSRGFIVEMARDGLEGVAKAQELRPDLILLDLYLPRLDGFGVMKQLKQNTITSNIPIVIISAWPTGDNRQRVQDAGAKGFVAKPFKVDELLNLIRDVLPQSPQPS